MDGLKTILLYVTGLAVLVIITVVSTRGLEPIEADPPLMKTATALALKPTATPATPTDPDCQATPGGAASGYIPNTPFTTTLAPPGLKGDRIIISGTIYASDCITPLARALIEIWQTDADGRYDSQPPYILRGRFRTDPNGHYEFSSIRPGSYEMGEGRAGPAHIHYRISYQGEQVLATRLLFADDPYLTNPTSSQKRLMTRLIKEMGPDGPVLRGIFDIVLPAGPPDPAPSPTPDRLLFLAPVEPKQKSKLRF